MRILIHYPGQLHKEYNITLNNVKFFTILKQLIKDEKTLIDYLNEEYFYSRFITYKNGKRFYSFNDECKDEDFILIIAANKLKMVKNVFEKEVNNKSKCSVCNNKDVVYIDNGILEREKEETYLCQDCFKKKIKEKAFENISHMKLTNDSIIDFGLSGERDSTIALYLLLEYRKESNMKFKINCVFNSVGLGEYDKNRLLAAKIFYKRMCDKNDLFTVNKLDMNFEGDFDENKKNIDKCTSKYCSICTRANGFREYGLYNNNKDLFTASGSGTIEDCFASKIMNKGESVSNTTVSYNFLKIMNFRRVLILEGILEDMISIYACLNNINYHIGDCPLSMVSPNYLCRENSLNLIKAKTNWITSSYGDINLKYNYSVLGRISEERQINLRNKCIKSREGFLYGINGNSIRKILKSIRDKEKPDSLEEEFYNICIKSKIKYLNNKLDRYVNIFRDEYVSNNVIIRLNNVMVKEFDGIYFLYNKTLDSIELLEITEAEREIISIIEKNKGITFNDLKLKSNNEFLDKVMAIQNLVTLGIIKIQFAEDRKIKESDIIYIQDKDEILNKSYQLILQDIFDTNENNIIFNNLDIKNCKEDDIVVIIESDASKIKEWYNKLKNISTQIIYIHISSIITIFTNNYEDIEKNWNIIIDNIKINNRLEDNIKKKYRVQILSGLSELILCDFQNIKNKVNNYNVMYYINLETGQKRKQLY